MSECVVRMEMPESCKKCKSTICLWVKDDALDYMDVIEKVQDFRKKNDDGFPEFCPIICQLPEGHGELIERQPIIQFIEDGLNRGEYGHDQIEVMTEVFVAPTIVPATNTPTETPTNTPTNTPTATERSET